MITRYDCALDGRGLSDIDDTICILDIAEAAPRLRSQAASLAGREGERVTRRRLSLSVTVTFEIRERRPQRRKAVADRIRAWAREGYLTLSDRPGQRLYVTCDGLPAVASSLRWTAPMTLVFTAHGLPFWESAHPARAQASAPAGNAATAPLAPAGTAPWCFLEAEVRNDGAAPLTALTVQSGLGDAITLQAPSLLAPGDTLRITHDEGGILSISSAQGSLLHTRTAASADDLILLPGQTAHPAVTADQAVTAIFRARGLYQ